MFVYYGYLLPLSTRIRRGLYEDGIWTDSGFMRYADIGGLTWKGSDTLVIASRQKTLARRLRVPGVHLGEVRHFLREKIGAHDIRIRRGSGDSPRHPRHARVSLTANVCNPVQAGS